MKTHNHILITAMLVSLWLGLAELACGFYDPSVQRWINRDPIGEPGFDAMQTGEWVPVVDSPNGYLFVNNSAVAEIDAFGLVPFCLCIFTPASVWPPECDRSCVCVRGGRVWRIHDRNFFPNCVYLCAPPAGPKLFPI
jgi:hypothetical protein